MSTQIREATSKDAISIVALIQELAQSIGESGPVIPAYLQTYLGSLAAISSWQNKEGKSPAY